MRVAKRDPRQSDEHDEVPDTAAFKKRVREYSEDNSCWFDARDLDLVPDAQWQAWMTNAPPNANLAISSKHLEGHGVLLWQWMTDDNGLEWPVSSQKSIQVKHPPVTGSREFQYS